jgi:hypothetical protein
MYKEPLARILAVKKIGSSLAVTLSVERDLCTPLAPASLHPVEEPGTMLVELHSAAERADNQVTFYSYNYRPDTWPLVISGTYIFRQWWSPDQLALAQDTARQWEKQRFVPLDAAEVSLEGGVRLLRPLKSEDANYTGAIVRAGWDHEHCALCWQRISAYEGDQAIGYSSEGDWICETCYQRYIESGFGKELGDQS